MKEQKIAIIGLGGTGAYILDLIAKAPVKEIHLYNGVLYISIEHCTAIHKCICGCGNEVVTPFYPTGWSLTFNGKTISLNPSIGNWNFKCKSHYFITNNKIELARKWSDREIRRGQKRVDENGIDFLVKFLSRFSAFSGFRHKRPIM